MSAPEARPTISTPAAFALIILMAALWGSSYSFVKIALETVTPFTLVAARTAISASMIACIVLIRRPAIPRNPEYWRRLVIQSLINATIPFTAFAWGQQYVSAGLAGIMNSTSPIFVFLITALWTRHEPAGPERLFGTIIGLGGVLTIVGLDAFRGVGDHVIAELVLLAATVCYALAAVHGRHFDGVAPEVTAAGTLAIAAMVLLPLSFILEDPLALQPTGTTIFSILYIGLASTGLTFIIYFYLVARVGSMNTVSASYLRAGFAVLAGMLILSEPFTWRIGVGLACVVIGVAAISGQLSRLWRWITGRSGGGEGGGKSRPAPLVR